MTEIPAGWYDDPENALQSRYWDGIQWTDHRAPKAPTGSSRRSAWQMVPETFALLGRCWRELVIIVAPIALFTLAAAIALLLLLDHAITPGIGDIIDRFTEPGFDPGRNAADQAFVDSITFRVGVTSVIAMIVGFLALMVGVVLASVLMLVQLASARTGHPLSISGTYRATMQRLPRIIGIYLLWGLVATVLLVALLLIGALVVIAAPLAAIALVLVGVAALIVAWPIGAVAATMVVVGPRDIAPLRSAIRLVWPRWGGVAGRLLVLALMGFAISIGVNIVSTPFGLVSLWAAILVGGFFQLVQSAIASAGSVVVYDWAGGPTDPALQSDNSV